MSGTTLTVEQLEERCVPAIIPGWNGPELVLYADLTGDGASERITVAGFGGAARVVVDRGEERLADFRAFEEDFRGGGYVTVLSGGRLAVTPGAGGGPRVVEWDWRAGEHGEVDSYYLPGVPVDNRDGVPIVAGPLVPGGPRHLMALAAGDFLVVDRERELSRVPVGAGWRFEPSGGWYETNDGRIGVVLDRGAVVDGYVAESIRFCVTDGVPL